jgi:hypothetical protein
MFKKRKYVQGLFSKPSIEEEAGVMFNFIFLVEIIKKILLKGPCWGIQFPSFHIYK